MEQSSPPYQRCIFICEIDRVDGKAACAPASTGFREYLKAQVSALGLQSKIRVTKSGCLDRCGLGPTVVIMPDNIWLQGVTHADLDTIVAQYITPLKD